ncbi:MAG: T9SS type A sorting domain-containing protein [Ignavibacteria bacterium]|jgi:hypothetical protein
MRIPFIILIVFLLATSFYSQTLYLDENFDYGDSSGELTTLTSKWVAHSGGSGTKLDYSSSGLSFNGYPSSSGGSVIIIGGSGTREDANRTFTNVNSGSLYLSFLINVSNATSGNGDYNIHLGSSTASGRFFVKEDGSGNIAFGISKKDAATDASFSESSYSLNTTYVIVIKYTFNIEDNNDDVSLFVFSGAIPGSEPTPTVSHATESTSDASSIAAVSLRQGAIINSFTVDGIRVSDSWSQIPLPVELTSLTALVQENSVKLEWTTATEINNYGFEIQRSEVGQIVNNLSYQYEWEKVGFLLGHGNSNSPKKYSFTDNNSTIGSVYYRLKQIDFDGTFEYSQIVEISLKKSLEKEFVLKQNYPNPFNPATIISYTIPDVSDANFASLTNVSLKIYDVLGNEITTLVNEKQEAGSYSYNFDASGLASGTYIYKLTTDDFFETKKMVLIK